MSIYDLNINLNEPKYDQSTYSGRFRHFFSTTSPLNCFISDKDLDQTKELIDSFRAKKPLPGVTEDKIWRAKYIYDSAFHPDTGEKLFLPGRMSFQAPGNMIITGGLLQFFRTTPQVFFWQWLNQTFNAFVNYSNRSGSTPVTKEKLGVSYFAATASALGASLGVRQIKNLPVIAQRFVPYVGVIFANIANIGCMRSNDITEGIALINEKGEEVGKSRKAGLTAIFQVFVSRVSMCTPGMILPPILMDYLDKRGFNARYPMAGAPIQITICGLFLIFTTPACCAIWPQKKSIAFNDLEPSVQESIRAHYAKKKDQSEPVPETLYYNKGL